MTEGYKARLRREMEVSMAAGSMVGLLYDALSKQYADPESERAQKSLNVLCVRLVFCLYAEDAGIFGRHGMFHDYLSEFSARQMRRAVTDLFKILDTKPDERDPYLVQEEPLLAAFPYVNGGLFLRRTSKSRRLPRRYGRCCWKRRARILTGAKSARRFSARCLKAP